MSFRICRDSCSLTGTNNCSLKANINPVCGFLRLRPTGSISPTLDPNPVLRTGFSFTSVMGKLHNRNTNVTRVTHTPTTLSDFPRFTDAYGSQLLLNGTALVNLSYPIQSKKKIRFALVPTGIIKRSAHLNFCVCEVQKWFDLNFFKLRNNNSLRITESQPGSRT